LFLLFCSLLFFLYLLDFLFRSILKIHSGDFSSEWIFVANEYFLGICFFVSFFLHSVLLDFFLIFFLDFIINSFL
jgi:hypothetical protein